MTTDFLTGTLKGLSELPHGYLFTTDLWRSRFILLMPFFNHKV